MARIPEDELERLKKEIPLRKLAEARGVKLTGQGDNLLGCCPFHEDKTPSFVISPGKNLWNCLGACQTGGTVIDFVMKTEKVSFRNAVELLRAGYPEVTFIPESQRVPLLDEDLTEQVIGLYQDQLQNDSQAMEYLKKRGIGNPEAIEKFRIGFSDRTLGLKLPLRAGKSGAELRTRLQSLGFLRESGHEHFAGSVVFPLMDGKRIVGVYGRKVCQRLRAGTPLHTYLPGPHKGIWNPEGIGEEVILCEAIIDALTFWVYGFRNVTASYGVNGFTPDHWAAFKQGGVKRVYIAYDRDKAGNQASESLALQLISEGIECFRVLFPMDIDANKFAMESDCPEKNLGALIHAAEWIGKPRASILVAKEAPDSAAKKENFPVEVTEREVILNLGDREYRVRGLDKNTAFDVLKVTIRGVRGELYHDDTLDLYQARTRHTYITQAAKELCLDPEIVKSDLGKVLFKLEELQEELIKKSLKPEKKEIVISDQERQQALELLKDPELLKRILRDFEACGIVGEEINKLACYLAAISRKLEDPLAILIQSSSSAGKSSLMDAVLAFMPEEEKIKYSAMTGQSLFYMSGSDLKHKILAIAEEEGAQKAGYALKLLQSEGELTIASTGKDPKTGRLVTQEYRVEGPVMIFMTTTGIDIDNELLNRCIVLAVDEDRIQTQAIHHRQRHNQTLEGLLNRRDNRETMRTHQNAQRLLRPLLVANPYADRLTFLNDRTRTRRDHMKYLTLIRAVTLLHQYQRKIETINHQGALVQYIEVTLEDIAIANNLAHEILGRTLDELPPQTRKLLFSIEEYVQKKCEEQKISVTDFRFSRREIREHTKMSLTPLIRHLERLLAMEYLIQRRGAHAGETFEYELLYRGEAENKQKYVLGLTEVKSLENYDDNLTHPGSNLTHLKEHLSGSKLSQNSPKTQSKLTFPILPHPSSGKASEAILRKMAENAHLEPPEISSKFREANG